MEIREPEELQMDSDEMALEQAISRGDVCGGCYEFTEDCTCEVKNEK